MPEMNFKFLNCAPYIHIMPMVKDTLYKTPLEQVAPFAFNHQVAEVFDDMVLRSIPHYQAIQQSSARLLSSLYQGKGTVYDLGCSTGNTILAVSSVLQERLVRIVGVDSSPDMVSRCRNKLAGYKLKAPYEIIHGDILNTPLVNIEAALLHFVLQFLPVDSKVSLLNNIYKQLPSGGCLILSEKIAIEDPVLAAATQDIYFQFKADQGYSDLEISQKREALENILHLLSSDDLRTMLNGAGFTRVEVILRWFNFVTIIAVK